MMINPGGYGTIEVPLKKTYKINQKQKSFIATCFYPVYLCVISRHFVFKESHKGNTRDGY